MHQWFLRRTRPRAPARSRLSHPDLRSPSRPGSLTRVGVLVYQGLTSAEIDEPVTRLAQGLEADVVFVGRSPEPVVGVEPVRTVHVDLAVTDPAALDVEVVVIPGGLGWQTVANDPTVMAWVAHVSKRAQGVLAISTGSLLLASVGQLAGKAATGHWLARDSLAAMGVDVQVDRSVEVDDHRLVTASGALAATEACESFAERLRWGP